MDWMDLTCANCTSTLTQGPAGVFLPMCFSDRLPITSASIQLRHEPSVGDIMASVFGPVINPVLEQGDQLHLCHSCAFTLEQSYRFMLKFLLDCSPSSILGPFLNNKNEIEADEGDEVDQPPIVNIKEEIEVLETGQQLLPNYDEDDDDDDDDSQFEYGNNSMNNVAGHSQARMLTTGGRNLRPSRASTTSTSSSSTHNSSHYVAVSNSLPFTSLVPQWNNTTTQPQQPSIAKKRTTPITSGRGVTMTSRSSNNATASSSSVNLTPVPPLVSMTSMIRTPARPLNKRDYNVIAEFDTETEARDFVRNLKLYCMHDQRHTLNGRKIQYKCKDCRVCKLLYINCPVDLSSFKVWESTGVKCTPKQKKVFRFANSKSSSSR